MAKNDDFGTYVDVDEFDKLAEAEADDETAAAPEAKAEGPTGNSSAMKRQPSWKNIAIFALIAATVSCGIAIYFATKQQTPSMQMPAGHATMGGMGAGSPQAQQTPVVDTVAEKKYQDILAANPHDLEAMKALAKVYITGGASDKAIEMENKVLAVEPTNTDALLELGVAYFGKEDYDSAEKQWLKVAELDPKNAECHYNLGFLYMTRPNPDTTKMNEHWQKVMEIAPTSDMAKTVSGHLGGGSSSTPAPTAKKS